MKRTWLIIETVAWVAFAALLVLIWASMLGDYHRITYATPGALGLPICVFIAGYAGKKRGKTKHPGLY